MVGSKSFISLIDEDMNYIKLISADLGGYSSLNKYVSGSMKYGSQKDLSEKDMLVGRMSQATNEIVISKYLAEELAYDDEKNNSFEEKRLELIDLQDEKYQIIKNVYYNYSICEQIIIKVDKSRNYIIKCNDSRILIDEKGCSNIWV